MKWLKYFFEHSLFTALCAAALTWQRFLFFSEKINWQYIAFVFFATVAAYNSYWLLSLVVKKKQNAFLTVLKNKIKQVLLIIISTIVCIYFLQTSTINPLLCWLGLLLYGCYAGFLIITKPKNLPALFIFYFIKTAALSLTWLLLTTINILQKPLLPGYSITVYCSFVFFFVLLLCIIFDKRDVTVDRIENLHLQTTSLQLKRLMLLGEVVCYVILVACSIYFVYTAQLSLAAGLCYFTAFYAYLLWLTLQSAKIRGYYFYYFLVDGSMLVSSALLFAAKYI
jgi:hypothetical protein